MRPSVPRPLAWLLAAVIVTGTAWTVVVPPFQAPDEDAHVAYVQTLAELHRRPADDGRPADRAEASTEQHLAQDDTGFLDSYQRLEARPAWSAADERRWLAAQDRDPSRRDGGGANPAARNLPVYYAYAAVPYLIGRSGTLLDRLWLMRMGSVLLLPGVAVGAWLLAGELTGRDRVAQLVAAAVAALAPMVTFIGSAVTPDALVFPLWALVFWLMVRPRDRGGTIALVALTALAVAVKDQSIALVPGVAWSLLAGRVRARWVLAAGGAAAVAVVVAAGQPRRLASYLWQFYVPVDVPGQQAVPALPAWPLRDVWLEGTTGAFGWLEVRFPWPVYALLAALGVVVAVAAAGALRRRPVPRLAGPAVAAAALVAGLHLVEHRMLVRGEDAFTQGRYLLGLAPLAGAAVALALGRLPARRRLVGAGAMLGGLAAWQVASLGIVLGRFYA